MMGVIACVMIKPNMKKEKDIFRLADLIARSLKETLNIEEQKELDDWLTVSPANREKYEVFKATGALIKKSEEYLQVDWLSLIHI